MTIDEAKEKYESGWWKDKTAIEIVTFQLYEKRLCMPFDKFHRNVEEVLGRPVWNTEFGTNVDGLKAEFEKCQP